MVDTILSPGRRALRRILTAGVIALSTLSAGCEEAPEARDGLITVRLADHVFNLDPALDDPTRIRGLAHRDHIDPDGGMVFAFTGRANRSFIMRHCPIPIDIAYVSDTGRIVTMYTMQPETPQAPGESDVDYEMRLKRYASRFPVRFVFEFSGGRLEQLGVSVGDEVRFDMEDLKRRAE